MAGRTSKSQVVVLRSIRYGGGRPDPASLQRRARPDRRDRQRRPEDEVALRSAPRAAVARRADAPPRRGRAAHDHRRRADPLAPHDPRGAVPAERRADRRRGDAAPARRAGGERARVRRAHAVPRRARRGGACRRPPGARPARAVVPAEAAVALGLPASRDQLRRMRRDGRARRVLGPGGRRRLPRARRRRAAALARRARGDRAAADHAARRRARRRALRAGAPRRPRRRDRPRTRSTEGFRLRTVSA